MSDQIPFEIQTDIIKYLPVKSLIRFRSVSKPWKALIDSSEFIVNYHVNHPQLQHHLLVRNVDSQQQLYEWTVEDEQYVSIADDDSFPQNKVPLIVPTSVKLLGRLPKMLGTSQGLFSFYNTPSDFKTMTVVIWNPTIRKSVDIVVPNVLRNHHFQTVVGFGVCPRTSDPKLVKITYVNNSQFDIISIPSQVEVFTLSLGDWRSLSDNLPRKSIVFTGNRVGIDRFIYWLVVDRIRWGDGYYLNNMILSFDMISEEFVDVYLPDSLARLSDCNLVISELRTSLVVLEIDRQIDTGAETREYYVWRMEGGVPYSFTKLFAIKIPYASSLGVHGFRKSGDTIIEMLYGTGKQNSLFVYEPNSENIINIDINGYGYPCLASSYMETLLLLDH